VKDTGKDLDFHKELKGATAMQGERN